MLDSFVNPFLLGGLALASIPIIIHLLNKRRFQIHDWAAMDFLLQAQIVNRRRLRLEDLILLLLRMAVVCLLVFAVARPVVEGFAGWREDERIVVLDDSGSMDLIGATGSVFDAARETAQNQILDALGGSIPVSLHFGSRPALAPLKVEGTLRGGLQARPPGPSGAGHEPDPALRAAEAGSDLLEALRQARGVDSSLRFAAILERIVDEISGDRRAPMVRSVVLVSDFRRVDWLNRGGGLREEVKAAFEEIARRDWTANLRFQFVNVGQSPAENIAITDFRVETDHVLTGVPVRIAVEVTNFSKEPRSSIEGGIEVGKVDAETFEPVHRIPLPRLESIPPGDKRSVEVLHVFEEPGQHPLRAQLENDRLRRDDESYLVVDVRQGLRVVVVDGDPRTDRLASESGFLIAALLPRGDHPTGVLPSRVTAEIRAETLRGADVALVLNRARLNAAEQDVLRDFLAKGGGIGFFLGNRVVSEGYREASAAAGGRAVRDPGSSAPEEITAFPALLRALHESRRAAGRVYLRIDEAEHPVFSGFRGQEGSLLEKVRFDKYFDLEPFPGASVLAHFDDAGGTPAVFGATPGKGRVLIFNTSADRDWSDWPTDPSYPIVLQEAVRYLAPSRLAERQLSVGDPILWDVTPGVRYEVITPDEERRSIEMLSGSPIQAYDGTGRAGFYRLVAGSGETGTAGRAVQWFACRWSPAESDLEAAQEGQLRSAAESLGIEISIGQEIDVDAFRRQQEGEIWRYMALGAGLFLLIELYFAWWFGRR